MTGDVLRDRVRSLLEDVYSETGIAIDRIDANWTCIPNMGSQPSVALGSVDVTLVLPS